MDRFFTLPKMTLLLLALLAWTGAWAQNMTTSEITVSFSGMSNGSQYSYAIASGSHTYQSGVQSGACARFTNASFDIGTQYEAYNLPLSMTLNGNLSFVSATGSSDAVVQNGDFTLSFTSPKYILRAIVTTGAKADTIAGNRTFSLTVTLPVNTQFRNVKLQITFADYATLDNFRSLGDNTYAISSKEDLARLAGIVNVQKKNCKGLTFRQTNPITCDNTYSPIGGGLLSFEGTYDGQDNAISGITVNQSSEDIGLFGRIQNATIQNVVLTHSNFSGQFYIGGIVAHSYYSSTVKDCRVLNVTVSASETSGHKFGAIVGVCDNVDYLQNNYYRGCMVCGKSTQVGIGGLLYASDCDGARSLHTITPYNVSVSGGKTVVIDNQTCYAAGVPITVSYAGSVSDGQVPQFTYNDGTDHLFSSSTIAMPAADITLSATLINAQNQITARPADGHYWTTFYDGRWRYQLPLGATAYTMGYDHHLYRLGDDGRTIPAGTPVVIISDKADIALARTNDVSPVDVHGGKNALLGSDDLVPLTGGQLGDKEVYVMGVVNDHLGFYTYKESAIPAGKAFYKEEQIVDLASLTGTNYTAQHGDILTGKCPSNVSIKIADHATVTLSDAKISASDSAGITCLGNATIILVGTNTIVAGKVGYAGICCGASGTKLTIRGTGSLTARGKGRAYPVGEYKAIAGAGIGGDCGSNSCGDICIEGGTITAIGGEGAAGIGCGYAQAGHYSCGSIYISGGSITVQGGMKAAAIGCGFAHLSQPTYVLSIHGSSTCGNITITKGVTSIYASKGQGQDAPYSIGKGDQSNDQCIQQCGTITIGGVNYGTDGITTNPFTYTP